jgi:FlaA1/EpsC-like NDP-sugar epimerase
MATVAPHRELQVPSAPSKLAVRPRVRRERARQRVRSAMFSVGEALLDAAMVVVCFLLANLAYHHLELGKRIVYPFFRVLVMAGLFAAVVVFLLERTGAYRSGISLLRVRETERIIRASIQAAAALFIISYLVNFLVSRWLLVIAVTLVPISLLVEKHLLSRYLHDLQARGRQTDRKSVV